MWNWVTYQYRKGSNCYCDIWGNVCVNLWLYELYEVSTKRFTSMGTTTAEKLRGTKVWVPTPGRLRPMPGHRPGLEWVRAGVAPSRGGGPGYHPRKLLKIQILNPEFWWLLCSLVGCLVRVYPSKQQAFQRLNQSQNFTFLSWLRPWLL